MDQATLNHLGSWLDRQFGPEDAERLRPDMIRLYETDPEYFGNAGWWKVYDQLCEERTSWTTDMSHISRPTVYSVDRITIKNKLKAPDCESPLNGSIVLQFEGGSDIEAVALTVHNDQHEGPFVRNTIQVIDERAPATASCLPEIVISRLQEIESLLHSSREQQAIILLNELINEYTYLAQPQG